MPLDDDRRPVAGPPTTATAVAHARPSRPTAVAGAVSVVPAPVAGTPAERPFPGVARPLYVAANLAGTATTFDVNAYLGAGTFYANGFHGETARIANIEGGLPVTGHQVFVGAPLVTYVGSGAASGAAVLSNHATATFHAIAGRGAGVQQQGIAYGVTNAGGGTGRMWAGNFVTGYNTDGSYIFNYTNVYTTYRDAILTGVNGVAGDTAHVVSSSWGGTYDLGSGGNGDFSRYIDALLAKANDGVGVPRRGVAAVFSAGNAGPTGNTVGQPGNEHNVFAVAALGPLNTDHLPFGVPSYFSSRGPQDLAVPANAAGSSYTTLAGVRSRIDIAAPGENTYLAYTTTTTGYSSVDGTSFAAPTVAGGVALLADRAAVAYPAAFADATDGRVVKAVLLNAADKTARWNGGSATGLDPATGAGRMALDQAYYQFAGGFGTGHSAMPAPNTAVAPTGWTRQLSGGAGLGQTYEFTTAVSKYTDLSATLNWFSNRPLTNTASGATQEGSYYNLDLAVDLLTGPGGMVVSSVTAASAYNLTEHASFLAPADGYYRVRVTQTGTVWNFDGSTAVTYGLAWSARPSVVAAAGTVSAPATASAPNVLVAPEPGQTAEYAVTGAGTVVHVNQCVYVGGAPTPAGNQTLTPGGTGTLTVAGGATLRVSDTLFVRPGSGVVLDASAIQGGHLALGPTATVTAAGVSKLGFTTISADGSSILSTAGTLTLPAFTNWNGVNIAALTVEAGGLTVGGAGTVAVGSATSGPGAVTKAGTGTVTLNAANTHTGGTAVAGGTLLLGVGAALPPGRDVAVAAGATLNTNGLTNTPATAVGTVTLNGGTLRVPSGNGDYYLTRLVTNGGTMSFAGTTDFWMHFVAAGAQVTVGGAAPSAWVGAGTSRVQNDTAAPIPITVGATGAASGIDLDVGTLLSAAGTNATFVKAGPGTMRLTNTANTAGLTVTDGGLRVDTMAALGSGTVTLSNPAGGNPYLQYAGPTATSAKALTLGVGGGAIVVSTAGTNLTLTGAIAETVAGTALRVSGTYNPVTSATLTLTGTNPFSGGTAATDGVVLAVPVIPNGGVAGPLGTASSAAANLTLGSYAQGRGELRLIGTAGAYTTDRGITLVGAAALGGGAIGVANAGTTLTLAGPVVGAGGLVKTGPGTLVVTGAHSHAGGTVVEAGRFQLGAVGGVPSGGRFTVAAGAEFNTGGVSIPAAANLDRVTLNGGTLRVTPDGSGAALVALRRLEFKAGTVDATAAPAATVALVGADAAITTAASNAAATLAGAAVVVNQSAAAVPITVALGTTPAGIDFDAAFAFAGPAAAGFRKLGFGTMRLTNTAATTADFTVALGRLRVDDVVALGSGGLSLDGGTLLYAGGTATLGKPLPLGGLTAGGGVEVSAAATTLTAAGLVSGGTLTKGGAGVLTLTNAANSFAGLTVLAGGVDVPLDAALGQATVTVNPAATVRFTASQTTGRTFTLLGGTLEAAAGVAVTLDGATVGGGVLNTVGTGSFGTGPGGATLAGVTTYNGTQLNNPVGVLAVSNAQFGGTLTSSSGATTALTRVDFGASARVTLAGTATLSQVSSVGQLTLAGTATNAGTPIVLGGGSRTTVAPTGVLDLGGQQVVLSGGLLINNGAIGNGPGGTGVGGAAVVIDYGGLAKGAGYYESYITVNGGRFSPGASPGRVTVGTQFANPGGTYEFEISNATGTAGPTNAQNLSGWDLTVVRNVFTPTASQFLQTATAANKFTISLVTLADAAPWTVAGPMANFNPAGTYSWLAFSVDPAAATPFPNGFDTAAYQFDTTGIANQFVAGGFALSRAGNDVFVTYTPVPEPAAVLAVAGGALAAAAAARRRRTAG